MTWPDLPVIYMSGTARGLDPRARLIASDHFLDKPFSADRLLLTIDLALQQSALGLPTIVE